MPDNMPSVDDLAELISPPLFEVWSKLCAAIEEKYDMERLWGSGGRKWAYEYKYRRGGKTLC